MANVIEDHQPLIGDAVPNGQPSLFLVIEKFPGANTLKVTRDVEAAMADMAPGLKGITIDTQGYRPASFIEAALRNVGWAALIGFMLLIALLLAMFGSWRAALIGAIVLPVSLTMAAYVLYLQGTTFTTITLLGLAAAVCHRGRRRDHRHRRGPPASRPKALTGRRRSGRRSRPCAGRWCSPPSPCCSAPCRSCSLVRW